MPSTRATSRSGSIERRVGALLLAAMLTLGATAARPGTPVLRIAVTSDAAPFSARTADGRLSGFNVEIMLALCHVMAATCRFDTMPFEDVLPAVAAGRYEYGLANHLRTPEREGQVAFSAPYWRSSSSVVGPPGETDRAVPAALHGRRVAVVRGSRQQAYLEAQAGTPVTVVEAASYTEIWLALADGRADLALVPTLTAFGFLLSDDGKAFATVGTPLMEGGLGGTVHVIMPRGRPELKRAVDEAIATIRADGSYQKVNRRYFPFDVY